LAGPVKKALFRRLPRFIVINSDVFQIFEPDVKARRARSLSYAYCRD